MHRARLTWGSSWMWATEYLNGIYVAAAYLMLLLVAVVSYAYAVWKTWNLTKSKSLLSTSRVLAFSWLIGTPLFILLSGAHWVSAMLILTNALL